MRLLAGKARVTPLKRNTTPRSELSGLLALTRLLNSLWRGFPELPIRVSLMGDSECVTNAVEAEDVALNAWFDNRVTEIQENMKKWEQDGAIVDKLHHWPTASNPADIVTKGQGTFDDIKLGGFWQTGPKVLQQPRDVWPASRDFKKGRDSIPMEIGRAHV